MIVETLVARLAILVILSDLTLLTAPLQQSAVEKSTHTAAVSSAQDDEPVIAAVLRRQPLFIGEAITFEVDTAAK